MASGKIRGITVEIGGDTTKLGKALQSSEMTTKSLQSELRQVDKLLQFDPGNVDLLAQKQKILTQAVEETSEKLKILEQAEAQVVEQFNKGDIGEDQLRAFQREIIETQNKLSKFESDLDGTGDSLKDVGDSAEQSGDGFTVFKGALADIVSNVIQSAISSIGNLVGSLLKLSEATEEYRTMQAKLSGSAETFGYATDFAKGKYEEFYTYLGDDQAATNAITNLMGIGTSTESVSKLAEGATAVWASYGDSIPIEGLTEAINETITVGGR
jgi:chromosome segregation ATPase